MIELPVERPLEDEELVPLLAEAIVNDQLNPGADLPFQVGELLPRLGHRDTASSGKFLSANGGAEAFNLKVAQLCWRFVTLGILVPRREAFAVTESGRQFLADSADDANVVLASRGLVRRLEERCPDLDYHASAVLLGVASEAPLQRLAFSLARVLPILGVSQSRSGDSAAKTLDWLEEVFRSQRKALKNALNTSAADSRWIDDLPRLLGPGTSIRLTRNEAGHPSDAAIDRGDAFRLFVLFPQMAEATFVTAAALDKIETMTSVSRS